MSDSQLPNKSDGSARNFEIHRAVKMKEEKLKSVIEKGGERLEIVEGDDILKYYLFDNYFRPNSACIGTLWNSCMRQSERNKFMKLYAVNPQVKMLLLLEDDDKVRARALLWDGIQEFDSSVTITKAYEAVTAYDADNARFVDVKTEPVT